MSTLDAQSDTDRLIDANLLRILIIIILAGLLAWPVSTLTAAPGRIPAVNTGGGVGYVPIADAAVRGDLSPVAAEPEVAGVDIQHPAASIEEMIRGKLSPIL